MAITLCIDIGNTRIKAGWFNGSVLLKSFSFLREEFSSTANELLELKEDAIIISSVSTQDEISGLLEKSTAKLLRLNQQTKIPILNLYQSPETLGKDRIAVVVGAKSIFPNSNVLVIDAGTCITYDFLNKKNKYLGGSISPGIQMRLRAMHEFTAKLPVVDLQRPYKTDQIGNTTDTCMLSGATNGATAEIKGSIQSYSEHYSDLKIVLTGGDSSFFEKELKNGIFADSNLVLKGLNEILQYNSENF